MRTGPYHHIREAGRPDARLSLDGIAGRRQDGIQIFRRSRRTDLITNRRIPSGVEIADERQPFCERVIAVICVGPHRVRPSGHIPVEPQPPTINDLHHLRRPGVGGQLLNMANALD